MAFLPLLPVSEPPQPPNEVSTHSPAPSNPEMTPTGSTRSLSESDCTSEVIPAESEGDQLLKGPRGHQLHLLPIFRAPSPSSTPSLSSASDTDTESEAPSTSNPSSPSELGTSEMLTAYFASALEASREPNDINPYFPSTSDYDATPASASNTHLPLQSASHLCIVGDPALVPPSTYPLEPSIPLNHEVPSPAEVDLRNSLTAKLRAKLQAVPSPSLVPPSPFSLYPSSNGSSPNEAFGIPVSSSAATPTRAVAPTGSPSEGSASIAIPVMRRSSVSRAKSSLSFSSSITVPGVSPAFSTRSGFSSISDTPEMTIERMREMNLGYSSPGTRYGDVLAPSISRKKSRE